MAATTTGAIKIKTINNTAGATKAWPVLNKTRGRGVSITAATF